MSYQGEERKKLDVDEFVRGQRDCREGLPCKEGESVYYQRGYGAQYQINAVSDAKAINQFKGD